MRATSNTLFVCVNTKATENAGMVKTRDGLKVTLENPKLLPKHMAHTSGPSKPKTINLALRHQCRYVTV